jgi:hypothetical protein
MLRRSGRLRSGEVTSARITAGDHRTMLSGIREVELHYSPDSDGDAPEHCLLKTVDPGMFALGRAEVQFYQLAAGSQHAAGAQHTAGAQLAGLAACYGTLIDEEAGQAAVLLEEVTGLAPVTEWPIPPAMSSCERMVTALAGIHSFWWGSDVAAGLRAERPLPQLDVPRLERCVAGLADRLGDALASERRALLNLLLDRYPAQHEARIAASGRHTIVHGDAHTWNFLVPADTARAPILIDWQLWGIDLGAADLAYMIGLHWFPERRRRFERSLIDTYTDALAARGIPYPADQAWQDYRLLVAGLTLRVAIYSEVIPASIWWPHLERACLAFEDLDCRALLD